MLKFYFFRFCLYLLELKALHNYNPKLLIDIPMQQELCHYSMPEVGLNTCMRRTKCTAEDDCSLHISGLAYVLSANQYL